jgi:hypothetical protein
MYVRRNQWLGAEMLWVIFFFHSMIVGTPSAATLPAGKSGERASHRALRRARS